MAKIILQAAFAPTFFRAIRHVANSLRPKIEPNSFLALCDEAIEMFESGKWAALSESERLGWYYRIRTACFGKEAYMQHYVYRTQILDASVEDLLITAMILYSTGQIACEYEYESYVRAENRDNLISIARQKLDPLWQRGWLPERVGFTAPDGEIIWIQYQPASPNGEGIIN